MERVKHRILLTNFAPTAITNSKNVLLAASIALSLYSLAVAAGLAFTQYLPSYFADEWTWLGFAFNGSWLRGSFCRFFGHPTVIPNLHLLANYYLLDGSALARAVVVTSVSLLSALGIARLTLHNLVISAWERRAVILLFACMGFWPALNHKFVWSFGLTDSLVTLGAVIASLGLLELDRTTGPVAGGNRAIPIKAFLLLSAGSVLATFSFGSGVALWPAFLVVLVLLRAPVSLIAAYAVIAVAALGMAFVGLPGCLGKEPTLSFVATIVPSRLVFELGKIVATGLLTIGAFPAHALANTASTQSMKFSIVSIFLVTFVFAGLTAAAVRMWRQGQKGEAVDKPMAALLAITLMVLGAALLVGLARSRAFGVNVAYSSRYAAMGLPFWMCAFALLWRALALRTPNGGAGALPTLAVFAMSAFLAYSNTEWSKVFPLFRRGADVGTLHYLIDPAADSEGLRRYYLHANRIIDSLPKLTAEGKDFMGSELARSAGPRLGRGMLDESEIVTRCAGAVEASPASNTKRSMVFSGWALDENGHAGKWVEIYRNGILAGLGMPSALAKNWYQDFKGLVPLNQRAVMAASRTLARAWSLYPGWVAVVRAGSTDGKTEGWQDLRFFLRTTSGKLCQLNAPA